MRKKRVKKGTAVLLSLAMLLGLAPAAARPLEVRAAENVPPAENAPPAVTQFAAKAELMNSFDLDDRTEQTPQKVIFGLGKDGSAQEWLIAGKDEASGTAPDEAADNIVLFAASPLKTSIPFNSSGKTTTYNGITVRANHYGASDLRVAINDLLEGTDYFSTEEQALMNPTTITTYDTENKTTYETEDTLYAAYAKEDGDEYIKVGTEDGLNIKRDGLENLLKDTYTFWLRSPYDDDRPIGMPGAMQCSVMYGVTHDNVTTVSADYGVVPAFDLDLSSVIFASAASAASSAGELLTEKDSTDQAFTLRYASDGDETAVINPEGSEVAITGASEGMYLVVQNSSGAYATAVSEGTSTVNAGEIDGIDNFKNCKVWLESTDTANRITTAMPATATYKIIVTQATGGKVTVSLETAPMGDTVTVTAEPERGYKLNAIYVDGEAITGDTFVMKDADAAVTAEFEKIDYSITVTQAAGGAITVSPETAQMGDTVAVTAEPERGYKLNAIYVDGEAITGDTFVMKDADAAVTAEFEKIDYSITVTQAAGGTITAPETAQMGDTVAVTAEPERGYKLNAIYVDGEAITGDTFMMPAWPVKVTAIFEKDKPAQGWQQDENGVRYMDENGDYVTDEIITVDGETYYLAGDGYRADDWQKISGKWYYFGPKGGNQTMRHRWVKTGGTYYYLDAESGVMQTSWVKDNNKWYYLGSNPDSGAMRIGWQKDNNKWYYLGSNPESGAMRIGWQKVNNKWYYLGSNPESGAMRIGWQKVNNKWYYLGSNPDSGAMRIGWQKVNNKWYYLGSDPDKGWMRINWQLIKEEWYYLGSDADKGWMQTGWQEIAGKWYYLYTPRGNMASDTVIDGYYVDKRGVRADTPKKEEPKSKTQESES